MRSARIQKLKDEEKAKEDGEKITKIVQKALRMTSSL